jgi:predicted O-methyltransferase YrrM
MNWKESFFRTKEFARYVLTAGNSHSIHSPFVFELYTKVIKDSTPFYSFEKIEAIRARMLMSEKKILVEDFGTGATHGKKKNLSIRYIASHYVKHRKYGQLLFRLVNHFRPNNILEIGTSLGITTSYLSLPNPGSKIITLEGSDETATMAELNFKAAHINPQVIRGEFSETLPIAINRIQNLDFVYFDGNHRKEPTLQYFFQCLQSHDENSVFVFDDIYWSQEMSEAWKEIKENSSVTLSIDLYSIGIVFFRRSQPKQHFTLRF